jgi:peroxidase
LGRRDSLTASLEESNSDLPAPFLDLDGLIAAFQKKNFSTEEMVTLSGNSIIKYSLNLLHQITLISSVRSAL